MVQTNESELKQMNQPMTADITLSTLKTQLETPLAVSDNDKVTLDFAKIGQIDSSALSYVLHMIRRAAQAGQSVSLVNLPSNFTELTKLYGIDHVLQPYL